MRETPSIEDEKRAVVLFALFTLGGSARKRDVLDLIANRGWMLLDANDMAIMASRDEARWRNDLAFTRHHLVLADFMSGLARNRWEITAKGLGELKRLGALVSKGSTRKLTPDFIVALASHRELSKPDS